MSVLRLSLFLVVGLLQACASFKPAEEAPQERKIPKGHMIAAAHPRAVDAGLQMLRQGGSAVDAAIATQAVLSLVEPESSGLGGGAFLLHFEKKTGAIEAYDGRETAPASARPGMFLKPDGMPMGYYEAAKSGRAVGVPGVVAMLWQAHRAHGSLPWAKLFDPAIALAENGFPASPGLSRAIAATKGLSDVAPARDLYFTPEGQALAPGTPLKDPAYAKTLRRIAAKGPDGFYRGPIAQAIIHAVQSAPHNPAQMTKGDLAQYHAKMRMPLCGFYRLYRICGMPPPSSGGVTVLAILKLLEPFDLSRLKPGSPKAVHLISEASRLAYADRARYLGDSDVVDIPLAGLLDSGYLQTRNALIAPGRTQSEVRAGNPPASTPRPASSAGEGPSTTHFTIVDDRGDVVSMTSSVEGGFGSNLMAGGFILNNQLTDFSFLPVKDGLPAANAVAPGKRPLSSMAPTLVFDPQGRLFAALGSPGGTRIIAYVAETLIALIDWKLSMTAAIALPRHVAIADTLELEAGTALEQIAPALEKLGHHVKIQPLRSGLHGIVFTPLGFQGGADPRREGLAVGD